MNTIISEEEKAVAKFIERAFNVKFEDSVAFMSYMSTLFAKKSSGEPGTDLESAVEEHDTQITNIINNITTNIEPAVTTNTVNISSNTTVINNTGIAVNDHESRIDALESVMADFIDSYSSAAPPSVSTNISLLTSIWWITRVGTRIFLTHEFTGTKDSGTNSISLEFSNFLLGLTGDYAYVPETGKHGLAFNSDNNDVRRIEYIFNAGVIIINCPMSGSASHLITSRTTFCLTKS
jgi:hypothetical protein